MKTRDLRKLIQKQGGWDLIRQYAASGNLPLAAGQILLLGTKEKALEILRLSAQYRVKEKLAKRYKKELDHLVKLHGGEDKEEVKEDQPYIWFCWLQGLSAAPPVVRNCYRSALAAYAGKGKVTLITADNYRDYVFFPPEIQAKIKRGIITGAHLADLIRLELLINYGGIWTDATVFTVGICQITSSKTAFSPTKLSSRAGTAKPSPCPTGSCFAEKKQTAVDYSGPALCLLGRA